MILIYRVCTDRKKKGINPFRTWIYADFYTMLVILALDFLKVKEIGAREALKTC